MDSDTSVCYSFTQLPRIDRTFSPPTAMFEYEIVLFSPGFSLAAAAGAMLRSVDGDGSRGVYSNYMKLKAVQNYVE